MTAERMRDAAYADNILIPWDGAVAGYLNTRPNGDPYHPWSGLDWAGFKNNRKLPIFVQSNPIQDEAENDAFQVLRALYNLNVPPGVRTALDLETAVNPGYVTVYGSVMHYFGYHVWPYGSADFIFLNPPLDGYWVADFLNGDPFEYDHPDVRATQYTNNSPSNKYDSSAVKEWVYVDKEHWWI